jgi:hypothetical protein
MALPGRVKKAVISSGIVLLGDIEKNPEFYINSIE